MSIQFNYKNKLYKLSNRNYLDDYSHVESKTIDMTLSGSYLYKYPFKLSNFYNLDRYPSQEEMDLLINSIIKKYNINSEKKSIILGSGTNGLIQNLVKLFFANRKGNMLTSFYSFNQAEYAVSSYGSVTKRVFLENYSINFDLYTKSIDKNTKMVYICNPNNPTGLLLNNKSIINFAKANKKVYIVVDESNLEFSSSKSLLEETIPDNIIILKSFSKAYGLANLRVGYMVCSKELEKEYKKNITVNEFSGLSCVLASRQMESDMYLKNVELIKHERNYLTKELEKLGIKTIPSQSNTIMTQTTFDNSFLSTLQSNDISVVPVEDEKGLIHIRIAIQKSSVNKEFIKRLKTILKINENF